MDEILSEKDLMPTGVSWGEWSFSLTNEQIEEKIVSLPKNVQDSPKSSNDLWLKLLSLLPETPIENANAGEVVTNNMSVICLDESKGSPMECSSIVDSQQNLSKEADVRNSSIEELTLCLVDTCNQAAPKLKINLDSIREEMDGLMNDIEELNKTLIALLMENSWSQLNSELAKFVFCVGFSSRPFLCKMLCQIILLPWMSKNLPTKLEQLSEILLLDSEIFCRFLIAPLLLSKDSPLVKDLFSLEEIMNSMNKKHWTILLTEVLVSLKDLEDWNVPILAMIIEHSEPTYDNVYVVVQLMSSVGSGFAQSRDFGSLLVAVVECVKPGFESVVSQLKLIANSYKGPLKFKALKTLNDLGDI